MRDSRQDSWLALHILDAARLQFGHLFEFREVIPKRDRSPILGNIALKQLTHRLLEKRRLVVAQLRLQPILGPKEDLTVGFPNAVALHPFPMLRLVLED
jgi:hypothetical protein